MFLGFSEAITLENVIAKGSTRVGLKQRVGLLAGPILGGVVYFLPLPPLTLPAHTLAAILTWVVVYWITEAIPLPITSLLGATFCVVAGLGSVKTVFANFAHPIIFMFIGSFFIAEALVVHKVDRRFATWLLSFQWVRRTPSRIFFAVGCATDLLSMWISNTAAVAIMVPIVLGLLSTIRGPDENHERYEPGVMLLLAYGAAAGGIVTMIGTPPNLIGVGLLSEQAGITLPFHTWVWVGLPLGIIMFLVIFIVLFWLHAPPGALPGRREHVQDLRTNLGAWTPGQVNTCVALGLAVCLWIVPGLLAGMVGWDHNVVVWLNA